MKSEENNACVKTFLNGITDDRRRDEAFAVLEMMASVTDKAPKMWGTSIVGFDAYRYKYETGGKARCA